MTTPIKTVGIAGTGLIGAGWAARLLFRGFNVIAYDVKPEAEERLKAQIKTAWPSLEALLGKPVKKGRLTFTTDLIIRIIPIKNKKPEMAIVKNQGI